MPSFQILSNCNFLSDVSFFFISYVVRKAKSWQTEGKSGSLRLAVLSKASQELWHVKTMSEISWVSLCLVNKRVRKYKHFQQRITQNDTDNTVITPSINSLFIFYLVYFHKCNKKNYRNFRAKNTLKMKMTFYSQWRNINHQHPTGMKEKAWNWMDGRTLILLWLYADQC